MSELKRVGAVGLCLVGLFGSCDGGGNNGANRGEPAAVTTMTPTSSNRDPNILRSNKQTSFQPIPGEIIVKLRDESQAVAVASVGKAQAQSQFATKSAASQAVLGVLGRHGVSEGAQILPNADDEGMRRIVKVKGAQDTDAALRDLRAMPEVEYAHVNHKVRLFFVPTDNYYASSGSWGQPYRDLWGLQKMSMEAAWDTSKGAGVVVAVIDTGLDYNHADIAANVWQNAGEVGTDAQGRDKRSNGVDDDGDGYVDDWRGFDFVNNDNDPMDDHGHGTHVSGTIAAIANNGGIVGVAPSAQIMAVKGFDATGSADDATLVKAIYFAANKGAKVINASWGGQASERVQSLADAVNYAHDTKGVVFVAAAGNNGGDVGVEDDGFYPANMRATIAVAATDHLDQAASFSNWGAKVDVSAPGGGDDDEFGTQADRSILSLLSSQAGSDMTGDGTLIVGSKYLRQAGTSMAAPHVSGLAALILAKYPSYTNEQVRQMIRKGGDDILDPGFDIHSGYGRVNATKALAVTSPLTVHLASPYVALTGLASVDVTGTVSGTGLGAWTLEVGVGADATTFTTLATGSTAVVAAKFATWNVSSLQDGSYLMHLTATTTSGAVYEDRMLVNVRNNIVTSPSAGASVWSTGQLVPITGTVASPILSAFTVSIVDDSGNLVPAKAITLANGGTSAVVNGTIATWNAAGFAPGHYVVTLTVSYQDGSQTSIGGGLIVLDPTLHAGWPVTMDLPWSGFAHSTIFDHFTAADVDGDGKLEIPVAGGNLVTLYKHDGSIATGWPRDLTDYESAPGDLVSRGPSIGDIDNDGNPEIVVTTTNGNVYAFHADGTLVAGYPLVNVFGYHTAIADINGDGKKELIVSRWNVTAVDSAGNVLSGWPVLPQGYACQPAVGDIDGDGKVEVVVLTEDRVVHAWSPTGVEKSGFPRNYGFVDIPTGTCDALALADLGGDGKLEIVIASSDSNLHVLGPTGAELSGWPKTFGGLMVNPPAIADLDGDKKLEIVVGTSSGWLDSGNVGNQIFAFRQDGTSPTGWPVTVDLGSSAGSVFGVGAPVIADVDADGRMEVVVTMDVTDQSRPFALRAFRYDGTPATNFSHPTAGMGIDPSVGAVVADIDGDGYLELVWGSGSADLVVYDLPTPVANAVPWGMVEKDPAHTNKFTTVNQPPQVTLTSPVNNTALAAPAAVTITATATDVDGTVAKVELFNGSTKLATFTKAPYTLSLTGLKTGAYTFTAKATDNLGSVGQAQAVVLVNGTWTPTADAFVVTSAPNSNYGSATTLEVGTNASGPNHISYLRFDAAQFGTATSVVLRLYGSPSGVASGTVPSAAYAVSNTTWSESAITWNTRPTLGAVVGTTNLILSSTVARSYDWDVTSYVASEVAAGRTTICLAVSDTSASTPYFRFNSKEASSNRASLIVTP